MGILDYGNSGSSSRWNYTDPSKENFTLEIIGDVVALEEVQALNFSTRKPEFWPDGNPKTNLVYKVLTDNGELGWMISPSPKSNAVKAIHEAVYLAGQDPHNLEDIAGKKVKISTSQGSFNSNNPRPWQVVILGPAEAEYRGFNPLPKQPVQQQPMQQPVQQMSVQQVPQQAYAAQPVQPMQGQLVWDSTQPQPQQGLGYMAAQAAQAAQSSVYAEDDIPF